MCGINSVVNEEFEWVQEESILDSGAFDSFIGMKHVDGEDIKQTHASKNKEKYWTACEGSIQNEGEALINAKSNEGIPIKMKVQVGDKVSRILIAVRNAVKAGNMVVFGASQQALRDLSRCENLEENVIYDKKTGIRTQVYEKDGMYKYPMWIRRRVRKESVNENIGDQESEWQSPNKKGKISWNKHVTSVEKECQQTDCQVCLAPFTGQA